MGICKRNAVSIFLHCTLDKMCTLDKLDVLFLFVHGAPLGIKEQLWGAPWGAGSQSREQDLYCVYVGGWEGVCPVLCHLAQLGPVGGAGPWIELKGSLLVVPPDLTPRSPEVGSMVLLSQEA